MKPTLSAQVLAHLRSQLITGMLSPGDKLSLRTLALQLGVSMQPVREAVARLVAERALEVTPKRSVRVPLMSLPQFRELTAIRLAIEGFAAEPAARRHGGGERAALRRFDAQFRRECKHRAPDVDAAILANASLHFAVYRAAGMPALIAIIEGLWLRIGPVLNLDLRSGENRLASGTAARAALREDIGSTAAFIETRGVLPPE